MSHTVTKRPQAKLDLIEIADFIAEDSLDSALRFLDAAEKSFGLLASSPEIGWLCHFSHPQATEIRLWRIKGFDKHLIFYHPTSTGVEIVRVLHGAQDIEELFRE